MTNPRFQDRYHAGRVLASWLLDYSDHPEVLVLTLPPSIPVAVAVAEALTAPLDVFLVHPLIAPGAASSMLGAVTSGEIALLDHDVIEALQLTMPEIERVLAAAWDALARREAAIHADRPPLRITGRLIIFVDDGLSAAALLRAAVLALQQLGVAQIVAALPV
ncbi:MAG: phosphoribosyltransferase, partial [Chloroflexales bacterium]|nr:phosphoribosyltransferase [Chloroflexales bacterium]